MLLINVSDPTIVLPGVEISGAQNEISSLCSVLQQKLSDLPKPTHIFSILNSGGWGHGARGIETSLHPAYQETEIPQGFYNPPDSTV